MIGGGDDHAPRREVVGEGRRLEAEPSHPVTEQHDGEPLARRGNKTRASATNRRFMEPMMRVDGQPDTTRLEFAFDAQTSGGLLISVDAERADELVESVRNEGANYACVVGEVLPPTGVAVILRP